MGLFLSIVLFLIYRIVIAKWGGKRGGRRRTWFEPKTWAFYSLIIPATAMSSQRAPRELPESSQRAPRELLVHKQTIPVWN
jgi:hypothetical protein